MEILEFQVKFWWRCKHSQWRVLVASCRMQACCCVFRAGRPRHVNHSHAATCPLSRRPSLVPDRHSCTAALSNDHQFPGNKSGNQVQRPKLPVRPMVVKQLLASWLKQRPQSTSLLRAGILMGDRAESNVAEEKTKREK